MRNKRANNTGKEYPYSEGCHQKKVVLTIATVVLTRLGSRPQKSRPAVLVEVAYLRHSHVLHVLGLVRQRVGRQVNVRVVQTVGFLDLPSGCPHHTLVHISETAILHSPPRIPTVLMPVLGRRVYPPVGNPPLLRGTVVLEISLRGPDDRCPRRLRWAFQPWPGLDSEPCRAAP